jgi:AcrR family transcriptional regulator
VTTQLRTDSEPSGPRRRGRAPDLKAAEAKRHEIVRAATQLFDKKGYHQTSMIEIAEAASLRKPSLYHYFSGKEEILYLIHDEMIDEVIEKCELRLSESATSVTEMLTESMVDIVEQLDLHPGNARVIFEYYRELPDDRKVTVNAKRDRYFAALKEIVEAGVERGEFDVPDVNLATLFIFGACNWAYQWYVPGGGRSTREIGEQFAAMVLNGIQAKRT